MTLFNPCKKCIVRSMCRVRCHARQDFWDTREKLTGIIPMILVSVSLGIIIVTFLKK